MPRFDELDAFDLPNGARGVIVSVYAPTILPQGYAVEVFNAAGSMGDGVTNYYEDGDRLVPADPEELEAILRQPPNLLTEDVLHSERKQDAV